MLLLLLAVQGPFRGCQILRAPSRIFYYKVPEGVHSKPMAITQNQDTLQPSSLFVLRQVHGLFKKKPKRIQYIYWPNLGKIWEQFLVPISGDLGLSRPSKILSVHITRI